MTINLKLGAIYHYNNPRRLYTLFSDGASNTDPIIQNNEPFLLLEWKSLDYQSMIRCKILSANAILGWINVDPTNLTQLT